MRITKPKWSRPKLTLAMREIDQEALIMLTFSRSARKYIDIKNKLKSKTAITALRERI
jgi:hypothetical protein